eukprot:1280187-Alexandrium_andersonii.AAC.1
MVPELPAEAADVCPSESWWSISLQKMSPWVASLSQVCLSIIACIVAVRRVASRVCPERPERPERGQATRLRALRSWRRGFAKHVAVRRSVGNVPG